MNTTTQTQIKTIDINAKEWFDKVNGNSYFAANITLNYGMEDAQEITVPFQYGYGDSYRYEAIKTLNELGLIPYKEPYYLKDSGIIVRYSKQSNCKKIELKNI